MVRDCVCHSADGFDGQHPGPSSSHRDQTLAAVCPSSSSSTPMPFHSDNSSARTASNLVQALVMAVSAASDAMLSLLSNASCL